MQTAFSLSKRTAASSCAPWLAALSLLAAVSAIAAPAPASAPAPQKAHEPAVAEIVKRNAAARGGVEAWQKLQTMVWAGHTESSNAPERKLSFLLELKRPSRMRFEIVSPSGKLVRIYDGTNGWKVHPDSNGIPDVKDYTEDELAFARSAQIIDGPLMDIVARGGNPRLIGTESIEDRKAFVLEARLPSGDVERVWVDAESFLELRLDREIQMSGGRTAVSTIVYRDYRPFKGLQIPVIVETGSDKATDKLVIEKVALDPAIDDKTFAKPQVGSRHHGGVIVDARGAPPVPPHPQAAQPQAAPPDGH